MIGEDIEDRSNFIKQHSETVNNNNPGNLYNLGYKFLFKKIIIDFSIA